MTRLNRRYHRKLSDYTTSHHKTAWDSRFDKDFDKFDRDFDRGFKVIGVFAILSAIVSTLLSLAILGFIGWAVVMTMQHFGII